MLNEGNKKKIESDRGDKLQRLRTMHLFAGAGGGILADILLGNGQFPEVAALAWCVLNSETCK